MKLYRTLPFLLLSSFLISCAEEANEEKTETAVEEQVELAIPQDTTPVSVMFIKVMGKENMVQASYLKDESPEDFMKRTSESKDIMKLVNVDVKGSPYAQEDSTTYQSSDESGAIKSRMVVYDMIDMKDENVDQPFRVSVITKVKDYKTWRWLYDMEEKNRKNAGMEQLQLGLNHNDPNEVFMLIAIPDIAKARELMEHPGLEKKMQQSGVIGKPEVKFWRHAGPQSEEL